MNKLITGKAILCVLKDANGDITNVVANDSSDNICIGGHDKDGKYHQYDSYEAYHAYGWAQEHGFEFQIINFPYSVDVTFESTQLKVEEN